MIANIQKSIAIGTLCAAGALSLHWWAISPAAAVIIFFLVFGCYSAILLLQFTAMRSITADDATPKPRVAELIRAWAGETLTVLRIFYWRQPFCSSAEPDFLPGQGNGKRGVVFIHGFFCNRGLWTHWLTKLRHRGHPFIALNLRPEFGSIDEYASMIDHAVDSLQRLTGQAPVLVCHSMGGLAARAWLRQRNSPHAAEPEANKPEARAHHIVTIGTPHAGTWLARFSHAKNARQMRLQSPWLSRLAQDEAAQRDSVGIMDRAIGQTGRWTCWYSNCDNIVFPAATATLPWADNRLLQGNAHVQMVFSQTIFEHTMALLESPH